MSLSTTLLPSQALVPRQSQAQSSMGAPVSPGSVTIQPTKLQRMIRYDKTVQKLVLLRNMQLLKAETETELFAKLELGESQIKELLELSPSSSTVIATVAATYGSKFPDEDAQCELIEELSKPVFQRMEDILTEVQYQKFLWLSRQETLDNLTRRHGLSHGTAVTAILDLPAEFAVKYDAAYDALWQAVLAKREQLIDAAETELFASIPEEDHHRVRAMMQTSLYFFLHNRTAQAAVTQQRRLKAEANGVQKLSDKELRLLQHAAKINATVYLMTQLENEILIKRMSIADQQLEEIGELPKLDLSDWPESGYGTHDQTMTKKDEYQLPKMDLERLGKSISTQRMDDQASEIESGLKTILTEEQFKPVLRILYATELNLLINAYCPTVGTDRAIALVCHWDDDQTKKFPAACDRAYRQITGGTEKAVIEVFQPFVDQNLPADKRADFLQLINQDTWRIQQR